MVDEWRRSGSLSEELMANLVERGMPGDRLHRLTAEDSYISLGRAATLTLPSVTDIVTQGRRLTRAMDIE